jgi:hypothetical protein
MRRWFFSKSGDFAFTLVFRTDAATRRPRAGIHTGALKLRRTPRPTVYGPAHISASAGQSGFLERKQRV